MPDEPDDLSEAFQQGEEIDADISEAPTLDFVTEAAAPLVGVDCGIVRLGETENGLVIELRGYYCYRTEWL